jgi:hypothetical protein
MVEIPYNANPELLAMKDDLADRKLRIKLIGMAVTGLFAVAAVASMFFLPVLLPELATTVAPAAKLVLSGGLAAASWVTSLITTKEVKKLEVDEQYIASYMQGKNYWGEGYREEVLEHGYNLQPPFLTGAPGMDPRTTGRKV